MKDPERGKRLGAVSVFFSWTRTADFLSERNRTNYARLVRYACFSFSFIQILDNGLLCVPHDQSCLLFVSFNLSLSVLDAGDASAGGEDAGIVAEGAPNEMLVLSACARGALAPLYIGQEVLLATWP
jgi:hypothetical protein